MFEILEKAPNFIFAGVEFLEMKYLEIWTSKTRELIEKLIN